MPQKTKADLERELKETKKLLQNIVVCFTREENTDDFNALKMDSSIVESLDEALDTAREFLK